ncbi:helix-turn-helix transcriptional regulator [Nocardiopsis synnemataformans]|uniref:helix-turn-helix transcriptional regulator n=1 Tax=Nocardiopsis synnemataformans TaxID=61305 RepID=UPI003EC057CB
MTQRTYFEEEGPTWSWWGRPPVDEDPEVPADDVHTIRWGYNLADLDQLARVSTMRSRGSYGEWADRYEASYSAIIERLFASSERPDQHDLLTAGTRGAISYGEQEKHHRGYSRKKDDTQAAFVRYWDWVAAHTASPEGAVVERTALWQIWPRLSDRDRRTLLALAASGDKYRAAEALGISPVTIKKHLRVARAAFLWFWHEGESPSRAPWKAAHARAKAVDQLGRPRLTVEQVDQIRARIAAGETYARIGADYGIGTSAVSRYVRGEGRPVDPAAP